MEKVLPVTPASSLNENHFTQLNKEPVKKPNVFWLHTKVLVWKQFLVFTRNIKSTLFQVATPVFICLFLIMLQQFAAYAFSRNVTENPEVISIDKIPKCYGSGCITLGIAYTADKTTPLTEYVLKFISDQQGLEINKDIQVIAKTYSKTIDYLTVNTNKTQTVVLFCTGEFEFQDNSYYNGMIDCLRETPGMNIPIYSLLINSTITPLMFFSGFNAPRPVDYASLAVKSAVDTAIFSFYQNDPLVSYKLTTEVQSFPMPKNRYLEGYDIVTSVGVFYFFIPPMVTFVVILIEVVREKEYKLRHGLAMIGMASGPYWLSWLITGAVFSFIVANCLIIASLACLFSVFIHTPYPLMLLLFFVFSMAMICLAFLLSTLIKTTKSAYTTSYAFILIGLVLQFLLSNITIIYLLYADNVPNWVSFARVLLSLYPPFNFSKAFADMTMIAGSHYSSDDGRWVTGDDYTWDDFTKTIRTEIAGTTATVPSTAATILTLIGNCLLLGLIAWYLDHTVASNRGTSEPFYFFLTPKYWGCKRKRRLNQARLSHENTLFIDNHRGTDVNIDEENCADQGISIKGLGKIFSSRKCCKKVNVIHAVNDVTLDIGSKELLTVLGHNGAGKSTLINILTGLTASSYGSASICGFDIHEEMGEIRKILGVCPQHDILWDELTPFEHLILFGRIKELSYEIAKEEAEEKLDQVKLLHVKDKRAGTFSGGMKRRLSVAIAGVGNPKIVILDEPTTGMDPINRRNAWKLIQKLKKGRVMILTTHSMEEADVLSDRVCVIVDGELKCLGTALSLKNNYGDGYRVSIISKDTEELIGILLKEFPAVKIIDSSGGSLVISLPFDKIDQIQLFFRTMEGLEVGEINRVKELIEEWGLSNTTLEEVFMRVTGKKPIH